MDIKSRLLEDVKNAMRQREKQKLDALRLITAAVKQIEVDERIEVDNERMLTILNKLAKQRKESIAQFTTANRLDLVEKEEFELALLSDYLPAPLSEAEVKEFIKDALTDTQAKTIADMGKVMACLKPKIQGRYDMSLVSALIKSALT